MPKPAAPRPANPLKLTDRKRLAILDAAISEFRQQGFELTSMDGIARTANVSKRTVYNHFASKELLFAEILTQLWQNSAEQVGLSYQAEAPLRPQLEELLWQKMRMLNQQDFIDLARVAIAETIHSPERAQDMVNRLNEREEGITTWIRAAKADGKLHTDDPAFAATQLQGMIKTFAFWPQIAMGQPPLTRKQQEHIVTSSADMFLHYYA
ncbi:TetR/AcrR family transcriptional regulator [uncultured Gilvimarinus sp.]|jgi:TetR/AcrR family transcriptional regulator of autoinduction and epiphytic fitness|uniref:TetR/AcrR family transcriptional regulator n=1 Tax=uncultured Gilvimarinus sp. TaxID=1689143 RepID=UPI0030DCB642